MFALEDLLPPMFKPTTGLLVRDWKQDVINLVQMPRAKCIPDPSPFALKLETWIRMNKLSYQNVSNDFTKGSARGQIPFIELNGRQFADSNLIIEHLIKTFDLSIDTNLNSRERAEARAITVLIEESLFRCYQYSRSRDFSWLASAEKGYLNHLTGLKKIIFQKIVIKKIQSRVRAIVQAQGYGRHSPNDIDEIAKKDLTALSTFLGNKRYLFGDRPSTADATMFGHLCQVYDTPLHSDKIKPFMEQSTPNLVEFLKRVKSDFWPDWDSILEHLALNPSDIKPVAASATTTSPSS